MPTLNFAWRMAPLLLLVALFAGGFARAGEKAGRLPVGDLEVLVITDADVAMEKNLLPGLASHPEFAQVFAHGPVPAVDRAYFFRSGSHNILVDTGWGTGGKVTGHTLDVLRDEGIRPADITDILLTHMDRDHTGGLLRDGKAVFPNATLWISAPEYEAWNSGTIEKRSQAAREFNKSVLEQYKDRIKLFNWGDEILPGITAVDASGHTPGHTAYDIKSGDSTLTVVGDLVHIAPVQLPLPELGTVYDVDMEKAADSRSRILERAANDGAIVAGMHFPMISDVRKRPDKGYMMREPRR